MISRSLVSAALVCLLLLVSPLCADDPLRVALVATGTSETADAVLELATVGLSQQESIVLLERQKVQELLAEQKASLSGVVSADAAIQVGKFLATDLFAAIEVETKDASPVGLVVFDARSGTRLWDQSLPVADVDVLARMISHGVASAVVKVRSDAAARRTVCLVTVRNADLPREFDAHRPVVAALLQRHLTRQPAVHLLERRHLEHFNRERNLAAQAAGRELIPAAIFVEIDLTRAQANTVLAAAARVRRAPHSSRGTRHEHPVVFSRRS